MSNIQETNFSGMFHSDGSNTLVIDLSSGPVSFGLNLVPNAKLATEVHSIFAGSGIISTTDLSKGILSITFSTPPLLGDQSFSGFIEF